MSDMANRRRILRAPLRCEQTQMGVDHLEISAADVDGWAIPYSGDRGGRRPHKYWILEVSPAGAAWDTARVLPNDRARRQSRRTLQPQRAILQRQDLLQGERAASISGRAN